MARQVVRAQGGVATVVQRVQRAGVGGRGGRGGGDADLRIVGLGNLQALKMDSRMSRSAGGTTHRECLSTM